MRRWIAFALIVICFATTTGTFAQAECVGPFKEKKPTDEQLAEVLAVHKSWLEDYFPDGDERRGDLCWANLRGAFLGEADLSGTSSSPSDLNRPGAVGRGIRCSPQDRSFGVR